MRSHRRAGGLIVGLASAILVAGCAATTTTPAPTVSVGPSAALVVASPTVMPAPTPSTMPTATPSATPTASPIPLRSVPASIIGVWTGVVREPRGIVEYWSATYDLGPCVSAEECGRWSWEGTITKTEAHRPWAVLGDTITCSGPLRYKGENRGGFVFLQLTTEFEPAAFASGCGNWNNYLKPTPDGGLDISVSASHPLAHGTLTRPDGSPAPSPSQ